MGVAYSTAGSSYSLVRADTSAHLLDDIHAAVTAKGWSSIPITDGRQYVIESPQGYSAKVRITDSGATEGVPSYHFITIQALSSDESLLGISHHISYGRVGFDYHELIVNECQLFLASLGISNVSSGCSVALGIPFVKEGVGECAAGETPVTVVTDIWWSCGVAHQGFHFYGDFRSARYCGNAHFCFAINGVLKTGPQSYGLRYFALTQTDDVDAFYAKYPRIVKLATLSPITYAHIYYEPFVGWEAHIWGQIWDALIASRDLTLGDEYDITTTDVNGSVRTDTWRVWNNGLSGDLKGGSGTYFGSLLLLKSVSIIPYIVESDYAY
jgi:hypothetical protein